MKQVQTESGWNLNATAWVTLESWLMRKSPVESVKTWT